MRKTGVLPWLWGGTLLGITFFCAVLLIKPIGVSTQFVIANGIIWKTVSPEIIKKDDQNKSGYKSSNAYLNKSEGKYAANIAKPMNYSFIFVITMMCGAFLSSLFNGDKPRTQDQKEMPNVWRTRFGGCKYKRYLSVFLAGFIVLFGARLAGGCTSGHMMSGMMQTALSGYLFALGAFSAGIPLAIILFKKGE